MAIIIINIIAFALTLLGSIIWGILGIFNWNLIAAIFGAGMNAGSSIFYILFFISTLWLLGYVIYTRGRINLNPKHYRKKHL